MGREQKTRYAILGLLMASPMSGYDMKKTIAGSLGFFWNESYGQLYPMLGALAADGLVTKSVQRQEGKPDRHVYAITDVGRAAFLAWLERPAEPLKLRVEALLKLIYGGHAPLEVSLGHLARFRAEQQALVDTYAGIEAHLTAVHGAMPHLPYWLITLRCGQRISRAFVDWCDEADALLREGSPQ